MFSYFPFISILILLIFSVLTPVVYRLRHSLALSWLVSVTGALTAWILILLTGLSLPMTIPLSQWSPVELFSESPVWLVDQISWPFALGLTSLALAVILTDVAREFEAESTSWAGSLALTALGLLSIFSGNSVTLLLGWAALDLTELIFLLQRLSGEIERRQAILVFSARAGGIFLYLFGFLFAAVQGVPLRFDEIPQSAGIFLLLSVSLRLGVVPSHVPFWREPPLRRGIGTISRLVPPAVSLVFMARVAAVGLGENQAPLLFILTGLAAIFAGISWFNASNELEGRSYFILGVAALALGAAIRGHLAGSLVWGMTLIFAGGFLFLYSARGRYIWILALLFSLGMATLPFTPTWFGGQLYAAPLNIWHLLYVFAQILLLAGYIQHSRKVGENLTEAERWVRLIYPSGLILLLLSYFAAAWFGSLLLPDQRWNIHLGSLVPGITVLVFAVARIYWVPKIPGLPQGVLLILRNIFSLGWFYQFLGWIFRVTGRIIYFITIVQEGEGGVLWALLLLTLLIAYLAGSGVVGS